MVSVRVTQQFPLSADAMWLMIGQFGDTGRWSGRPPEACVHAGEGIGSLRTLTIADGRVIVDRLIAEGPLSYTYEIVSSPLPVASYRATMAVAPLGPDSCEFTWSGEVEPAGIPNEQAVALFEGVYRQGIGLMQRQIAQMAK